MVMSGRGGPEGSNMRAIGRLGAVLTVGGAIAAIGATCFASSASASDCGAEGQRACCWLERKEGDCNPGLVQIPGCSGDCLCSGKGPVKSSGTCVQLTECGGKGQRACCVGERKGLSCDDGLVEFSGCEGGSPQCRCRGGITDAIGTCCQPYIVRSLEPERQACASWCYESSNCYSPDIGAQELCRACLRGCADIPDEWGGDCARGDAVKTTGAVRLPRAVVDKHAKSTPRRSFPSPKKRSPKDLLKEKPTKEKPP